MPKENRQYDDPLSYIDEKYRVDSEGDSGFVEYDPEGAEEIEFVYKTIIAKMRMNDEDFDLNYDLELLTLSRIYGDIWDEVEKRENLREKMEEENETLPDEAHDAVEVVFRVEVADSVLLYYTLANEIVRGMEAELLEERVFDSREENTDSLRRVDHSTLARFLYHTGTIEKKLKDEIINANKVRNRLVHEFTGRHYLEGISDVLPMIDRLDYVINEMYDILYDGRPLAKKDSWP